MLSPFHGGGGGIEYLKDQDSSVVLAGVYTPGRASQVRQVEG